MWRVSDRTYESRTHTSSSTGFSDRPRPFSRCATLGDRSRALLDAKLFNLSALEGDRCDYSDGFRSIPGDTPVQGFAIPLIASIQPLLQKNNALKKRPSLRRERAFLLTTEL
ncbi:hypothetical protein IQ267_26695 [filamentous cyanobacterium LEGE 07170]|nr:hypothetical protein [filamentous cyanobacterium LEGE 07170]